MKLWITLSILLIGAAVHYPAVFQKAGLAAASLEDEYFPLKEGGRYKEAIKAIQKWSGDIKDPIAAEINLFRIQELVVYPELHAKELETLQIIAGSKAGQNNPFLRDRIDIIKNMLFLKKGDIRSSKSIQDSFSYLNFHVMEGPSSSPGEESEKPPLPDQKTDSHQARKTLCQQGKWFRVEPDRTGAIDFSDIFTDTNNSIFYLSRNIEILHSGDYYLILGKTGITDLWLNGTRIFSNISEHGFCHDQYFISVRLAQGMHRILIKAGAPSKKIKISLRIADINGGRIRSPEPREHLRIGSSNQREATFFPSLAGLLKSRNPNPEDLFAIGYLYFMSQVTHDPSDAIKYLSKIPERHPLYSSACYYRAMLEQEKEKKYEFLEESARSNPKNIEALAELAALKIRHGLMYEAFPVINKIKNIDPASPWYFSSLARFFIKKKWLPDALRYANALKKSASPCLGYRYDTQIRMSENDFFHALPDLEYLCSQDQWDKSLYDSLLLCYERSSRYDKAVEMLFKAAAMFPPCIRFKLSLARIIEYRQGAAAALPYLSAALKISPHHSRVLYAAGNAYHKMGKTKLAAYYLYHSLQHDPGNSWLKVRIEVIKKEIKHNQAL